MDERYKEFNDKREQRVVPELFTDTDWLPYEWGKNIDFTPVRKYYVSSYSKNLFKDGMKDDYGDCLYGYKNDRIIDLIGPIGIREYTKMNWLILTCQVKWKFHFLHRWLLWT